MLRIWQLKHVLMYEWNKTVWWLFPNPVIHRISEAGKYSHEQDAQQMAFGLMPALQPVVKLQEKKSYQSSYMT